MVVAGRDSPSEPAVWRTVENAKGRRPGTGFLTQVPWSPTHMPVDSLAGNGPARFRRSVVDVFDRRNVDMTSAMESLAEALDDDRVALTAAAAKRCRPETAAASV